MVAVMMFYFCVFEMGISVILTEIIPKLWCATYINPLATVTHYLNITDVIPRKHFQSGNYYIARKSWNKSVISIK